ncbi:MAG: hypothetical protein OEW12_02280 [Deltaproteobacteria bacterium]|nr:hypothetical protein [Deltaproteobacteria bacterium]
MLKPLDRAKKKGGVSPPKAADRRMAVLKPLDRTPKKKGGVSPPKAADRRMAVLKPLDRTPNFRQFCQTAK